MGISERKEREKQEMRQRIIDAAMHMFLTEGYDKTSIRNIAEAIEYSPATIYLYYKDKDELLYEVQRQAYGELLNAFVLKAKDKDPWKKLQQIGRVYVEFGLANQELYDLMFILRAPMNVDHMIHKDNGEDCFSYLVDCLVVCMEKGLLRITDVHVAALSLWSMAHGLVSLNVRCRLKVLEQDEAAVEQLIQRSMDEYLRIIKA